MALGAVSGWFNRIRGTANGVHHQADVTARSSGAHTKSKIGFFRFS